MLGKVTDVHPKLLQPSLSEEYVDDLYFFVNGKEYRLKSGNIHPEDTLLTWLRAEGLTGTKLGCGEGGCGACTIMVSYLHRVSGKVIHRSANACLTPLCAMDGVHVTTVEGIGRKGALHPVQQRLAESHGSQCGFCTPGIVMSMYSLLRSNPNPSDEDIEHAFDGNLCRCTGYRPILHAFRSFSASYNGTPAPPPLAPEDMPQGPTCGNSPDSSCGKCPCGKTKEEGGCGSGSDAPGGCSSGVAGVKDWSVYVPSSEPIFPPALKSYTPRPLRITGRNSVWFRPTSLAALMELKTHYPHAKIAVGNTELEIERKFKRVSYQVLITTTHVPELNFGQLESEGVRFGATVTITSLLRRIGEWSDEVGEQKARSLQAMKENIHWFAGHQIRNNAAIGGNICTASPISDLNPVLIASGAEFRLRGTDGTVRDVNSANFFTGYRKTAMSADEVLESVFLPFTSQHVYARGYKQSKRRDDDIAIVNAGCWMSITPQENGCPLIRDARLAFGGMAPFSKLATESSKFLQGKSLSMETLNSLISSLGKELFLKPDTPGGMVAFRQSVALSFAYKFFVFVLSKECPSLVDPTLLSACEVPKQPLTKGAQHYASLSNEKDKAGAGLAHVAAEMHVTGEAQYVDDIPVSKGTLFAGIVGSKHAHAKVLNVNPAPALALDKVHEYVGIDDLKGSNWFGSLQKDEEIFVQDVALHKGQIIGLILAEDQISARIAAELVDVEYEVLPAVIGIDAALEAKSFIWDPAVLNKGNVDNVDETGLIIVEDEMYVNGQEHFYLETQACLCTPLDSTEMDVIVSTQNPTKTQTVVASALGIPKSRVTVRCRRMGGGFGGKETRNVFLTAATACAAQKLRKPVRVMLDRDEDMSITGQRHPFKGTFRAGVHPDGRLEFLDVQLYANAGCTMDLTRPVLERAMFHIDNAYDWPNLRVTGHICKTNQPSNTAFRGFGGPQGMIVGEAVMEALASKLDMPPDQLRAKNFMTVGSKTHYGQEIEQCLVQGIWSDLKASSDYDQRRKQVDDFNAGSRFVKRGLSITPVKFGMSFTATFMNQANALVHVEVDGSVRVAHGGTEMGQGIHTKMVQVAATALGVDASQVFIAETSTATCANTMPSAASMTADINGQAVYDACKQICMRMAPVIEDMTATNGKSPTFAEAALECHFRRVDLSAHGFYKTPDIGMDWETGSGRPFHYFAFGAAVSEVQVDCLTGDMRVLRTDILHDVGKSLNPILDIGQIEGAYIQGLGLFALEEMIWMKNGSLFSAGPSTYKIPSFNDVPVDFRVALYSHKGQPVRTIYGSKGVGEPPLMLAVSVYTAIRDAINSSRKDAGAPALLRLDTPATCERIRMSCVDDISKAVTGGDNGFTVESFC